MVEVTKRYGVTAIALLVMGGCGGGGGGGGGGTDSRAIARIATPSTVDERTQTRLDGSGSSASGGAIASYSWSVIGEAPIPVEIVDGNQAIATLRVGEATTSAPITIRLTVSTASSTATADRQLDIRELDEARLPPDPGTVGSTTVAGIDANGNQLRDDVERAIYQLHKDSLEDRATMMIAASTLQNALASGIPGSSANKDTAADNVSRGIDCLFKRPELKPRQTLAVLKSLVINTPDRLAAYQRYDSSRGGTAQEPAVATVDFCMTYAK